MRIEYSFFAYPGPLGYRSFPPTPNGGTKGPLFGSYRGLTGIRGYLGGPTRSGSLSSEYGYG